MAIQKTQEQAREVVLYNRITSPAAAQTLKGSGSVIMIQCETQPCRYRLDGTAPTSTVGTLLPVNEVHTINVGDALKQGNVKIIQTAVNANVNYHVFK